MFARYNKIQARRGRWSVFQEPFEPALNRGESTSANFQPAGWRIWSSLRVYKITKTSRSYRGRDRADLCKNQEARDSVRRLRTFRWNEPRDQKKKKREKKKERTERKRHRWEVEREVVGKEAFLRCEDQEEEEYGREADKNEEGKVSKFCGRTRTSGGIKRKKADQESCEDPIIGGYCGIITLAAAPVPACRSPEGLLPSPRSHSKPLGRPAFCR